MSDFLTIIKKAALSTIGKNGLDPDNFERILSLHAYENRTLLDEFGSPEIILDFTNTPEYKSSSHDKTPVIRVKRIEDVTVNGPDANSRTFHAVKSDPNSEYWVVRCASTGLIELIKNSEFKSVYTPHKKESPFFLGKNSEKTDIDASVFMRFAQAAQEDWFENTSLGNYKKAKEAAKSFIEEIKYNHALQKQEEVREDVFLRNDGLST